jgi:hypothetical protein
MQVQRTNTFDLIWSMHARRAKKKKKRKEKREVNNSK